MARYALDPLLDIRQRREDELQRAVAQARQSVAEGEQLLLAAQEEYRKYVLGKPKRQNQLYAAVMNQVVTRDHLDRLKEALGELEQEGVILSEKVMKAEDDLKRRQEELEAQRAALLSASKGKMKLDLHKSAWQVEEAREEERQAESETEDLATRIQYVGEDDDTTY